MELFDWIMLAWLVVSVFNVVGLIRTSRQVKELETRAESLAVWADSLAAEAESLKTY